MASSFHSVTRQTLTRLKARSGILLTGDEGGTASRRTAVVAGAHERVSRSTDTCRGSSEMLVGPSRPALIDVWRSAFPNFNSLVHNESAAA